MREIKFRVFDKKIGKIFKAHDLRFTAEEAIYEVCHDTIRDDGGKHWEFTDFKEVVLMQYTGLKDIEGKEIYEGDILELPNGTQGVVEWLECGFVLRLKEQTVWQNLLFNVVNHYTVVGNIHEPK